MIEQRLVDIQEVARKAEYDTRYQLVVPYDALALVPKIDPETLPIVHALKKKLAEEHEQLRYAKKCIAGLSMLLKAIDGKVIMDIVRPIAEKRLNQYRDRYPSANVIMDEEDT